MTKKDADFTYRALMALATELVIVEEHVARVGAMIRALCSERGIAVPEAEKA